MPLTRSLTPSDVKRVSPTVEVSLTAKRYCDSWNSGALSFTSNTIRNNTMIKVYTVVANYCPSHDSSIGSISTWYWGGPGYKSWQGQEFFSENKQLNCLNFFTSVLLNHNGTSIEIKHICVTTDH